MGQALWTRILSALRIAIGIAAMVATIEIRAEYSGRLIKGGNE